MTALSQAIFALHQPDVDDLKDALLAGGKSQEEVDALPMSYFKERCTPVPCQCFTGNACPILQGPTSCAAMHKVLKSFQYCGVDVAAQSPLQHSWNMISAR